jgi:hypothetical protein
MAQLPPPPEQLNWLLTDYLRYRNDITELPHIEARIQQMHTQLRALHTQVDDLAKILMKSKSST